MDINTSSEWPGDFAEFRRRRTRFFDRLAAEAAIRDLAREITAEPAPTEVEIVETPIVVEGELSVLTQERRLVMGYYGPTQRDLADVIREATGAFEAFGVAHVGSVRIRIEFVTEEP